MLKSVFCKAVSVECSMSKWKHSEDIVIWVILSADPNVVIQ